jgi:purine nucleosidase
MRSFVIDTDTASDDSVALLFAALDPTVTIRAITVVAGNVPLPYAVRNALGTLALISRSDIEVHAGRNGPILRPLQTAQDVHGEDGMASVALPAALRAIEDEHAVDALRRLAHEGGHTLVTLGPLSNIAAALLVEPDLLTRFEHTYLMAGAPDGHGNVNTLGEFNVWADPEAASIVFNAPGAKTMIGWNISRLYAVVTEPEQEHLRTLGPLGEFICEINRNVFEFCRDVTGLSGYDLPDPVAMHVALDESIVLRAEHVVLGITTGDDPASRGHSYIERRAGMTEEPNVRVIWEVDEAKFKARLMQVAATPLA